MRKCRVTIQRRINRTEDEIKEVYTKYCENNIINRISYSTFRDLNIGYDKPVTIYAVFHTYGHDYTEFENNVGNYSTAIIEDCHGITFVVVPEKVEFLPNDFYHEDFMSYEKNFGRIKYE